MREMKEVSLQRCTEKQPIVPDLVMLNPQLKISPVTTATIVIKTKQNLLLTILEPSSLRNTICLQEIKSKCSKNYNGVLPIVSVQVPQVNLLETQAQT